MKNAFEYYFAKSVVRKMSEKAKELGVQFDLKYNSYKDEMTVIISKCMGDVQKFVHYAGDFILDNDYARTVKYKYV
jgi:hypothetical protein